MHILSCHLIVLYKGLVNRKILTIICQPSLINLMERRYRRLHLQHNGLYR